MRTADSRTLCLPLSKEGKIPPQGCPYSWQQGLSCFVLSLGYGIRCSCRKLCTKVNRLYGIFRNSVEFTACFSCSRGAGFPLPKWAGRGMAPLPYHKGETYHHLIRGFSQFSQPQNLLPQFCRTQRFIAPDGKGCHPCRKIAHSGPQGQGFFGRATLPLLKSFLWLPGSASGKDF